MLSDACLVRVTGLRKTNDCLVHILYRVDAPALASYNLQGVSFQQPPPKFIVHLPQSVFECAFNAQRCVRSFGSIAYECKTVRY